VRKSGGCHSFTTAYKLLRDHLRRSGSHFLLLARILQKMRSQDLAGMRCAMRKIIVLATLISSGFAVTAEAQDYVATLRGPTPLNEQPAAPPVPKVVAEDTKRQRSYPEQPPTPRAAPCRANRCWPALAH
jgi:hypothetical protein